MRLKNNYNQRKYYLMADIENIENNLRKHAKYFPILMQNIISSV